MESFKSIAREYLKPVIIGVIIAEVLIRLNDKLNKSTKVSRKVQADLILVPLNQNNNHGKSNTKFKFRKSVNKMLTFPEKMYFCKSLNQRSLINEEHCGSRKCQFEHSFNSPFRQLLQYLYSAEHSIDLCLYLFTSDYLYNCIAEMSNFVDIRLIIDQRENESYRSKVSINFIISTYVT